jgi:hypothetical protein
MSRQSSNCAKSDAQLTKKRVGGDKTAVQDCVFRATGAGTLINNNKEYIRAQEHSVVQIVILQAQKKHRTSHNMPKTFNPDTEIPDLSGKVIVVTGGTYT